AFGKAARDRLGRDDASVKKHRAITLLTVERHAVCPHRVRQVGFEVSGCTEHRHYLVPVGATAVGEQIFPRVFLYRPYASVAKRLPSSFLLFTLVRRREAYHRRQRLLMLRHGVVSNNIETKTIGDLSAYVPMQIHHVVIGYRNGGHSVGRRLKNPGWSHLKPNFRYSYEIRGRRHRYVDILKSFIEPSHSKKLMKLALVLFIE